MAGAAVTLSSCEPPTTSVFLGAEGSIQGVVTLEGSTLPGVVVNLQDGPNDRADTTTTAGAYAFGVAVGSYTVQAVAPDSVTFTIAAQPTTASSSQTATVNFTGTHTRTSSVTGHVRVGSTNLAGVSVALTGGPESISLNGMTGAGGTIAFTGLRRGSYTVSISGWEGDLYRFTTTSQAVAVVVGQAASAPFDGELLPQVVTDTLKYGRVAVAYADTLRAIGGSGGYTWSIVAPDALPVGLTLSASTGVISGTPTQMTVDTLVVRVTTPTDADTDTVRIRIGEKPVASVEVAPALDTVEVGRTTQLVATPRGPDGSDLTGRAVTWSSTQPSVTDVDATGLVEGVSPGQATIRATSEGVQGSATIVVVAAPAIRVAQTAAGSSVDETGRQDTITVALWKQPAANVSLTVQSGDGGEVDVNPTTLTFTSADWATPQTVTLTGIDDPFDDGDQATTVTVAVDAAASSDEYDAVPAVSVSVATVDDDEAGVTLSETAGTTRVDESGATDTVTVVLRARPAGSVVLSVGSDDTGEATVSPATLTFAPADWATPQVVTVTGVDDDVADGDQTTTLSVAVDDAGSSDEYDAVPDNTVSVTTVDDPAVRIVSSFDMPGGSPTGISWDGTDLWIADNTNKLYRFSTEGALLETHDLAFSVSDLAWDGANLWAHLSSGSSIVKLDAEGAEISRLDIGYWAGSGFAFDGSAFWIGDYNIGRIYKHAPDGTLQRFIETNFFGHPTGITYDGADLLVGDSFELYNRVYRITTNGVQADYIDIDALGLTRINTFEKKSVEWDGQYLWYSSDARFKVYKLAFERPVAASPSG